MAGKQIDLNELSAAVDTFCKTFDNCSYVKPGPDMFEVTADGEKILVYLVDGKIDCPRKPEMKEKLIGIIMDNRESPGKTLAPVGGQRMAPRKYGRDGAISGSAIDAVRECQSTEKTTYSTGGGRKAAAAKTNIAALMEAGGSLGIISRTHKTDFIEISVRAMLGDRHVDSSMSIYKQEYLAKRAWDWIVKILMDEPGIVTGTDEWGMPEFREGATIKVRIADEGKSVLVSLPAKIALWRELAREWQFAARVCESKAYSRAADMILRADFQAPEEIAEEQSEISKIAEGKVAEAA